MVQNFSGLANLIQNINIESSNVNNDLSDAQNNIVLLNNSSVSSSLNFYVTELQTLKSNILSDVTIQPLEDKINEIINYVNSLSANYISLQSEISNLKNTNNLNNNNSSNSNTNNTISDNTTISNFTDTNNSNSSSSSSTISTDTTNINTDSTAKVLNIGNISIPIVPI